MRIEKRTEPDSTDVGGRYSNIVKAHTVDRMYKAELAFKSVLELLALDPKSLILYHMQPTDQPKTTGEIRRGVKSWLRSLKVPKGIFKAADGTVKHYFWNGSNAGFGHSMVPGQLLEAGFVEREVFLEHGAEISKYRINASGNDLAKPIIASAINFVHHATKLANGHRINSSLHGILGEKHKPLMVYDLLKHMIDISDSAPLTVSSIISAFKNKYAGEAVRRALLDLGEAGIIEYTSTGTIRRASEGESDHQSFIRFALKDIRLPAYSYEEMERKVMGIRRHRVPLNCFLDAAQLYWDVKPAADQSGQAIGTLTVSGVADALLEKYGMERHTSEQYASEIFRVFSILGAIEPIGGISGAMRSIVKPNELAELFYNTVLKPARFTVMTLSVDERLNTEVSREAIQSFLENYEAHRTRKGDPRSWKR